MSKPPMHALKPGPSQADSESVPSPRGVVVQLAAARERLTPRPLDARTALPFSVSDEPHETIGAPEGPAEPETHIHYIRENLQFLQSTFDQLLDRLRTVRDAGSHGLDATDWAELQDQVTEDLSFLDSEVPSAIRESLEGMAAVAEHVHASHPGGRSRS